MTELNNFGDLIKKHKKLILFAILGIFLHIMSFLFVWIFCVCFCLCVVWTMEDISGSHLD